MSIFGDVDPDEIPEDPYASPLGTWLGEIVDISTFGKDDGPQRIKIVWQKDPESDDDDAGNTFDDIFLLSDPALSSAELKKRHSWLRNRLIKDLEVPEDKFREVVASVESMKDALLGTKAYVTTVKRGDWVNATRIELAYGGSEDEAQENVNVFSLR